MTATGVALSAAGLWTVFRRDVTSSTGNLRLISARRSALHTEQAQTTTTTSSVSKNRRLEKINGAEMIPRPLVEPDFSEAERASLKDYFEQSKDLIRSDGGPPRWFSPLESGSQMKDSPLLLFLPDLVKLVEETIRTENSCSPNRPIYLFGESLGGCLALAVAARNPTIDLVLILANPATSFSKSLLPPLIPLLEIMPDQLYLSLPYMLSLMGGDLLRVAMASMEKILFLQQAVGELSEGLETLSSYVSEDSVDLVTILKGASFYRRARNLDPVSDYIPPTPSEFKQLSESSRWFEGAISPVMLSTLANGKVVRGLEGIPLKGPVLLVGNHMLLGLEVISLVPRFLAERNILVRGIAHPNMFLKPSDGGLDDISPFDSLRLMGAVPVSGVNFYKLLSSKSHVLLYPGGMREALHRKGEEFKLFWPEQSEFVRMAARFGATIIPFGVVGEDDIGEVVFDYNDQMKIPFLKTFIEELTGKTVKLRSDCNGEVANQDMHTPGILPKIPGRFYFRFGKPIETEGRKHELKDRERCQELYLQVKSEVESCIDYLREKRENDPYRNIMARVLYQATQGSASEIPTFEP